MPVTPAARSALASWAGVLLVFALSLACYWPALGGALLWDDPAHVTAPHLRSWAGLVRIWTDLHATQQYYPVLHTAFWFEHRLWGDATTAYHLLNVLLHATSCCLLAALVRRLWILTPATKPFPASPIPTAAQGATAGWLAALLFAVHPVAVESVAWISEQKNTLSLVFYLGAALAYFSFAATRKWSAYATACGLFLLALGTKSVTATLPAALLVVLWWRQGTLSWRREVRPLVPWLIAGLAAGLFTAWVERTLIGAEGAAYDLGLMHRVLLASRVVWFYLGKLAWPADLLFFYPHWDVPAAAGGWWIFLLGGVAVTGLAWTLRRRMRGPLAVWLLFVGSLLPALGFMNVFPFAFSYVADHFQYLASVGVIAGVAAGVVRLAGAIPPAAGRGVIALALLALGPLAWRSHRQSGLYRDNEALTRATLAANPDSWMAHQILATSLARTPARAAESIPHYEAAIRLNPDYPDAYVGLAVERARTPGHTAEVIALYERALRLRPGYAEAHNNLGLALAAQPGRLAEAIGHFEAALRSRPNLVAAHVNLAQALLHLPNRTADAVSHYETALRLQPDDVAAHKGLGAALARSPASSAAARTELTEALRLAPDDAEAHALLADLLAASPATRADALPHYEAALRRAPSAAIAFNLANTLAALPDHMRDAVPCYETALRLNPNFAEAHANLANALVQLRTRSADAIGHYEAALRIDPKLAWVHLNLAQLLASFPDRYDDALAHGQSALQLNPGYLDAYNTLAILYAQHGRLDEARAQWEAALHIDPRYEIARKNLQLLDRMKSP